MNSSPSPQKKSFLSHVSGIRGIAILLVVLFHVSNKYFPNCFFGVEVFFVISGFFFLQSLQHPDDFHFRPFLVKKLRRILIPLGVLTACVLPVCILLYPYDDLELAAATALSALCGASNLYLSIYSGGYFDNSSANNPMLHTWYVSALLQLFILCGLGVYVYRKLPTTVGKSLVWGAGILSFLWGNMAFFNYVCTQCGLPVHLDALIPNYYNPLTRLWEFLAGGCILLLPAIDSKWMRSLWTLIGFFAILVPSLCPHNNMQYLAFLPILATILLIRYLPETPLQRVVEFKPLMWVGTISYSIYLTHLPFIVFYKWIYAFYHLQSTILMLIVMSVAIAYLFYCLVEKRKFCHSLSWLWLMGNIVCCGSIIGTNGLKNYVHLQANSLELSSYHNFQPCTDQDLLIDYPYDKFKPWNGLFNLANCEPPVSIEQPALLHIGNRYKKPSFLLLGDSHAHYLSIGLDSVLINTDKAGVFCTSVFIPFMDRYLYQDDMYYSSSAKTEALFTWLEAHPEIDTLLIGQRWNIRFDNQNHDFSSTWNNKPLPTTDIREHNTECLADFCRRIKAMGRQVIIFTTCPSVACPKPLRQIRKNMILGRPLNAADISCTTKQYMQENAKDLKSLQQIENQGLCKILHQEKGLLKNGIMDSYQDGIVMHWDWDHLTAAGSVLSVQNMKDEILFQLNHPQTGKDNTSDGRHEN